MLMEKEKLEDIKYECRALNLEISAICGDLSGHGFEILAKNAERIEKTKKIIDLGNSLDCGIITMHIGVIPSMKNEYLQNHA